jgi:cyclophilin family peptidyl-prolyl cis-trans isomerase
MRPLPALAITLLLVAAVVAGGIGLDRVAHPPPSGAFAACKTDRQLAPHVYAGPPAMCIDTKKSYSATIKTTKGDFSLVLLTSAAPKTVNNFIVLAVNGYYNGLTFFNVQDWVVQSGDPENNGQGGPGYTLPEEPPAPTENWTPGSVGMSRFPGDGISGSQLFVLKAAWPGGNPTSDYNHFATVTLGFDVVGQLTASDRILSVQVKRS